MGRPRVKTIDSAVDLEKIESVKEETEKLSAETEEKVKKQAKAAKITTEKKRKKLRSRSKRYEELIGQIDKTKEYTVAEAIELTKKTSKTKFDSSLEIHINLNTDPTKSDQLIRKTINLPHSSGKIIRVLVFGGNPKDLKNMGVQIGTDLTLKEIDAGKIDTDKIVATSEWMPKLAKSAKVLGPKGLMPNPKSGTVTEKPEDLVKNLQGGMVEVKAEKAAIIHLIVGKTSSQTEKLEENIKTLISEIRKAKPEGLKKELIKSVYLSSTMGPSVKLNLSEL